MGFRPIDLCVLTNWASIRDPVSIGDRRLFKSQDPAFIRTRTSEAPAFIRDRRLFETRRLIEVLR